MKIRTLAIVGVGLIGGSIALAARARRVAERIVGVEFDPDTRDFVRDRCLLDDCFQDVQGVGEDADAIVVCTPVDRIADQLDRAAAVCSSDAFLTDVGSAKGQIVRDLAKRLPKERRYVGSHPLAGSEKQGAGFAHGELLRDKVVVVTPTDATSPTCLEKAREFWQAIGARVVEMSPAAHDQALALTSHLPHLVAAALAGLLPPELHGLTAGGFRDTTRVAAGEPELWTGIFLQNRDAILKTVASLEMTIGQFRTALEAGDRAALDALLTQGKRNRDALGSRN
jgi:prephenate dehydrogenase